MDDSHIFGNWCPLGLKLSNLKKMEFYFEYNSTKNRSKLLQKFWIYALLFHDMWLVVDVMLESLELLVIRLFLLDLIFLFLFIKFNCSFLLFWQISTSGRLLSVSDFTVYSHEIFGLVWETREFGERGDKVLQHFFSLSYFFEIMWQIRNFCEWKFYCVVFGRRK